MIELELLEFFWMNWYSPELLGFFILAPYDENILHKLPFESIVNNKPRTSY